MTTRLMLLTTPISQRCAMWLKFGEVDCSFNIAEAEIYAIRACDIPHKDI